MFEKAPMATYIVSQICFDPETIATWVARGARPRHRAADLDRRCPGSSTTRGLLRISMKIGLGESARFLRAHRPGSSG